MTQHFPEFIKVLTNSIKIRSKFPLCSALKDLRVSDEVLQNVIVLIIKLFTRRI